MSNARPAVFPRLEPATATPPWVETRGEEIRSLLSHIKGDPLPEPAQPRPHEPEPIPGPEQEEPMTFHLGAEEQRMSRLPPPPGLGSLIPGARSNPPPANDTDDPALRQHAEAFANAAVELAIARAATLAVLEGQLLDLALEVASAVIEREVELHPELHATLAKAALNSIRDCSHVTLRTSPDAFETICSVLGGERLEVRGVNVQVLADPSIPGLGCVVDGENVRIDATVSERLRAVRRAFEEERRKVLESVE